MTTPCRAFDLSTCQEYGMSTASLARTILSHIRKKYPRADINSVEVLPAPVERTRRRYRPSLFQVASRLITQPAARDYELQLLHLFFLHVIFAAPLALFDDLLHQTKPGGRLNRPPGIRLEHNLAENRKTILNNPRSVDHHRHVP